MKQPVSVVLIGVGGYGATYLSNFTEGLMDWNEIDIRGIVDPFAANSPHFDLIKARGIPIYETAEAFYAEKDAQLAVISTPIPLHRPQTEVALSHGSVVLCEKPLVTTSDDWRALKQAESDAGLRVGVGFQWSFSKTLLAVKEDILSGVLGRPKMLKTFLSWPRSAAYYNSSSWKGRIRDAQGNYVNDSVLSNATAHYLHNIFFMLGESREASAMPDTCRAEIYRAKDIETFDTAFAHGTIAGAEFYYAASHAVTVTREPIFHYEFENAVVSFNADEEDNLVRARFHDGRVKVYGNPHAPEEAPRKLAAMLDHVRTGAHIPCGIDAVLPHLKVCERLAEAYPAPFFPDAMRVGEGTGVSCPALYDDVLRCFNEGVLPSDAGLSWAKPPVEFSPGR